MGEVGKRAGARIVVALSAIALLGSLATPSTASGAPLKRCAKAKSLQCGTVTVPLDRSGRVKGSVRLAIRRLPAKQGPALGTVVFVAGGPGQSAISSFPGLGGVFRRALPRADIVTFDQRGTGKSGSLPCRARSEKGVIACGRRLGARRSFYRTSDSADDLEAVRKALGAPVISLYSVSYGGRVAGEYARRYPTSVGRMVLDSPTPLFGLESLDLQKLRALPRVLDSVCANGGCSSFTKSVPADLARLAAKARRRPLKVTIVNPRGRRIRTRLPAFALYGLVTESDLSSAVRNQIPAAVKAALRGDTAPLARLTVRGQLGGATAQGLEGVNIFLNRVTNCSESNLPWSPASRPGKGRIRALGARLAALGSPPFAPFGPRTVTEASLVSQCLQWPSVASPGVLAPAPGPPAPTLVLNGQEDLRTPVEDGRAIAATYPAVQQLVVPYVGHSVLGTDETACASKAVFAFLNGGPAPAACPAAPRPGSVSVPLPVRFKGLPGNTRKAKTLAAAVFTLDDVLSQFDLPSTGGRFGGLRGGRVVLGRRGARLLSYQAFSGVRLSGRLGFSGPKFSARLRITGGGARPATVRVVRGRLRLRFSGAGKGASASVSARLPRSEIPHTPRAVAPTP